MSYDLRRTKIVATLGPSSFAKGVIDDMVKEGVNVFRLNMSHLTHDQLKRCVHDLREVERLYRKPIGILVDLQGQKLRVGTFAAGQVTLNEGDRFILDLLPDRGDASRVQFNYPKIYAHLKKGQRILLDDGKLELSVVSVKTDRIEARVCKTGTLSDRKGIAFPDIRIPCEILTQRDRADLQLALALEVDWIAISFVQTAADASYVKSLIGSRAALMSKLEKPQALDQLEEIIDVSDGIMIARGDLGVELSVEKIPALQKRIIDLCRSKGKPVVVATQMLESMVYAPVPTRAEVSDVANAVNESADAIMLSAESASGLYPIESVKMMARIAIETETQPSSAHSPVITANSFIPEAIAKAAECLTQALNLSVLAAWSASGTTVMNLSRLRPNAKIIGLIPDQRVARRLAMYWGVYGILAEDPKNLDDLTERALRLIHERGLVGNTEPIIVVAGVPFGQKGSTNMIRILSKEDVNS